MIVVGLTGGIASGKSTASRFFKDAGAEIVDADAIARQVVKKGLPAYEAIIRHFGNGVVGTDGEIDRKRLAAIIFHNHKEKETLDAIVHPHVIRRTHEAVASARKRSPHSVVILDVPLLFEAGMDGGLDEIIVVYIPESLQLKRLMDRDHLSQGDAMARIRSQLSIEKKREKATIVLDNTCGPEEMQNRVMAIYARLQKKAVSP